MVILGEGTGGDIVVYTLGVWDKVFTGGGGGAVEGGLWAITLGASGGFTLVAGWVFCCAVEDGGIGGKGLGRKMLQMRVRDYSCLV